MTEGCVMCSLFELRDLFHLQRRASLVAKQAWKIMFRYDIHICIEGF
jgi:hypothetical protein